MVCVHSLTTMKDLRNNMNFMHRSSCSHIASAPIACSHSLHTAYLLRIACYLMLYTCWELLILQIHPQFLSLKRFLAISPNMISETDYVYKYTVYITYKYVLPLHSVLLLASSVQHTKRMKSKNRNLVPQTG